jgi:hypothetical protein
MPQEIVLTPVHLVRDASNFKAFHYHILQNISPGFENPPTHFRWHGPFKATHQCHLMFSVPFRYINVEWVMANWLRCQVAATSQSCLLVWLPGHISLVATESSHFLWSGRESCLKPAWITGINSALGRRNHTNLILLSTRSSVIHSLSWTRTVIPWGNFCFAIF